MHFKVLINDYAFLFRLIPHTTNILGLNDSFHFCELELNRVNQTYVFSEQTDVAGGTITLQLGIDVVDIDSGDFPDVTSSDVEDDINLQGSGGVGIKLSAYNN